MDTFNVTCRCSEIILQHMVEYQTEIKRSLRKLCVFKVSRGHPSKVTKLLINAYGLLDQCLNELHRFSEINV